MVDLASIGVLAKLLAKGREILTDLRNKNLSTEHKAAVDEAMIIGAEANEKLFEIQGSMIELQEKNADLAKQLEAQDQWQARIASYQTTKTPAGGIVLAKGDPPEHYACPTCAEAKKQIHILQDDSPYAGTATCKNCGTSYEKQEPKPIPQPYTEWP
jgi:rubredoxin